MVQLFVDPPLKKPFVWPHCHSLDVLSLQVKFPKTFGTRHGLSRELAKFVQSANILLVSLDSPLKLDNILMCCDPFYTFSSHPPQDKFYS